MSRVRLAVGAVALTLAASAAVAPVAQAAPQPSTATRSAAMLGTTTVTTAPGIATTLLKAGVLPLPQLPQTGVRIRVINGLQVAYRFPITGSTANLASGTGDILHSGGITFVSRKASLAIGNFDIDLAAGKVFATRVNGAPGRIAVLDLDLSKLSVSTSGGTTVLSGIVVRLDPAAAGALNATFHLGLPTDGSLVFGSAKVALG